MKINEIIKERRLAKNLTQEQIATYLGVTTPAVNKWEKGTSYPDITILPALARLLETDLNTLLSFQDNLTNQEIHSFLNYLSEVIDKEGFKKAYTIAMEKIKEYPNCYPFILNVALLLDGALFLNQNKKKYDEDYQTTINSLYQRALQSQDHTIQNQAQSILISKYMGKKEYEKAQELLQTLPDATSVDKKQLQINLLIANGDLKNAAKLEEEKLLSATNEIHSILITLMEIALKENRIEDAKYIADVSKNAAKLFDLWEYHSYVAHFQFYSTCKNRTECLKILVPMIRSLTHKWDINQSPLYRYIQTKKVNKEFGSKMQKNILQALYTDKETSFLKDSQEMQALLKEFSIYGEDSEK